MKSCQRFQTGCLVPMLHYEGESSFWGVVIFHCVEISLKSSKRLQRVCLLVSILYYEGESSFWGVVIFQCVEISLKSRKKLQRVCLLVPILYYEGESSFWGVAKVAASDVCSTFYDNTPPQREDRFNVKTSL